jgi:IS5 family transposase
VIVDTTVMEKTIAHPTDARLYERARSQLVDLARETGVKLRQSYARLAPKLARQVVRYAHARQFKRMRKALCQSSDNLGQQRCFPFGGSGSSLIEIMRFQFRGVSAA